MLTEMFIDFITDKTVQLITLLSYIFFLFTLFLSKGIAVLSDSLQEKN